MRRNIILAVMISLALSSCATYDAPDGKHLADPSACGNGVCGVLIVGALVAAAAAVAGHH